MDNINITPSIIIPIQTIISGSIGNKLAFRKIIFPLWIHKFPATFSLLSLFIKKSRKSCI